MLLLFIAGFIFLFAIICFARYYVLKIRGKKTDYDAGGIVISVVSLIVIFIGLIVSGAHWVDQISDLEDVRKFRNVEAIYQTKAEVLTVEFAKYLADTYPKHEKDIYDKISPDKVGMYFAKYPELRASETLVALVNRINELQSDVYDQEINVEQALKDIRSRSRNPWFFQFMIPTE